MRRAALLLLAVLAGVMLGVAGAVALRGPLLAEAAIQAALARMGIVASVAVRGIGFGGIELGALRIGVDGPEAASVTVGWSLRGQIDTVRVEGLRVRVVSDGHGVRVVGLPAGGGGGAIALPVRRVDLADGVVTVVAAETTLRLAGDGSVSQDDTGTIAADLRLEARLAEARAGVPLTLQARHAPATGKGEANLVLMPLHFATGRQPKDLFPALGAAVRDARGSLAGQFTARWDGKGMTTALRLVLDGIGLDSDTASLRDLSGTVSLSPAWPPRTAAAQRLTGNLGMAGLPAGPLELVFTLPAADRLVLRRLSLGLAGGILAVEDVTLRRDHSLATSIAVRGVDLAAVLALLDLEGLGGTGVLDGTLPVSIGGSAVAIRDGKLAARGPGTLRYVGKGIPEAIGDLQGAAGDAVRLAQQALTDFHYTDLTLTVDRAADGNGSLLVNLAGANPAVGNAQPFVLNIRLEANFDRLALLLLDGYGAAGALLRQAARP